MTTQEMKNVPMLISLAVFNHHEIPVELRVALKLLQLGKLLGRSRDIGLCLVRSLHGGDLVSVLRSDLVGHVLDLLADRGHALFLAGLDVLDLLLQVVVALAAVVLDELLVLERAHPVMRRVLAVRALSGSHVAVGAAVAGLGHRGLLAAVHGLELGMLNLDRSRA